MAAALRVVYRLTSISAGAVTRDYRSTYESTIQQFRLETVNRRDCLRDVHAKLWIALKCMLQLYNLLLR